jgi:hypothetical protein
MFSASQCVLCCLFEAGENAMAEIFQKTSAKKDDGPWTGLRGVPKNWKKISCRFTGSSAVISLQYYNDDSDTLRKVILKRTDIPA